MERETFVKFHTDEGDTVHCINYPRCMNTIFKENDWLTCPECGSEFEVDDEKEGLLRYWWREHPKGVDKV